MTKTKINSRKANCPYCNVGTGSRHNKTCVYAYKLPEDSKRVGAQKETNTKKASLLHRLKHKIGLWNGYCDAFYIKEHLYMSFTCVECGKRYGTHCIDDLIDKLVSN